MVIITKVKFKCPRCGSENVVGWKQKTMEYDYYLNSVMRKGTYLSVRKVSKSGIDTNTGECWGYKCYDCGEFCSEYFGDNSKNWRIEVD